VPSPKGASAPKEVPRAAVGGPTCPPEVTRAQCLTNVRGSSQDSPSYPVSGPRGCLRVMSRAQCEALLREQAEAGEHAGPSFEPKECLRFYSREECEAVAAAIEAQRDASQQAGD